MSNSSLVSYTNISPNKTSPRNHAIDTITIHCMAGNLSVEQCGNIFKNPGRKASSNYGIGTDGRIGLYVEEKDRSWASSNSANDNRAITIEVANDGGAETGWHVSEGAYSSLIALLVDICQRNGIRELKWKGDKSLIGQVDKQNMTVHRWFAAKACPGDYLYNLHSQIAKDVNDKLGINISVNPMKEKTKEKIQNDDKREKKLWDRLKSAGFTDIMTAAVMGNIYDESHFFSNNLQNSFEKRFNMNDEAYTSMINNNLYPEKSFVNDKAGYGLGQWTYWSRKQALYDYTIKCGFAIDDFDRQVSFLINELSINYKGAFKMLKEAKSIQEASNIVLTQYEKPADQGPNVQKRRAEYAQTFYNKYAGKSPNKDDMFVVKVDRADLNIRSGPSISYPVKGTTGKGTFTIVETKGDWGLLKSYSANRDGWINLAYTKRV